jgi:hypothetical protein
MDDMDGEPNRDGEHVCEACERTFESAAELERHVHEVGLVD